MSDAISSQDSLVPCTNASPRGEALGDRHSLLLTSADSANGVVSDGRGQRMSQTEDSGEHFRGAAGEILAGRIAANTGCTCGGGKGEGFADRQ